MPLFACPRCGLQLEAPSPDGLVCGRCGYPHATAPAAWGQPAATPGYSAYPPPPGSAPAWPGYGAPTIPYTRGPGTVDPNATSEDRTMAVLTHVLGIVTGFLGPLILWVVKKDRPFVDRHGRNALDFQFTILAVVGGALVLTFVVTLATLGLAGLVLFPLLFVVALGFGIMGIVCGILGAMRANEGREYRYPMSFRFMGRGL